MNCFTWITGVPVHVDIRWISYEECHLILFHLFSTCIFHMYYWCTYLRVYLVDIMLWLSLDSLLICIPRVFLTFYAGRPERMGHNTCKSMGRVLCVVR